jgi:hypothetical protein
MTPEERYTALSRILLPLLTQITEDYLLLPTLPPTSPSPLSTLLTPLLSLEHLFPRGRITDFIPSWPRYRFLQQFLDLAPEQILALWGTGRGRGYWDVYELVEVVGKRFGVRGEETIRALRREYGS